MIPAIYKNLCQVCGNDFNTDEALMGRCKKKNKVMCRFYEDYIVEEFFEFFRKIVGEPRAIQKFWAKRILRGESFAAVAPTGIGKTTFGSAVALFLALRNKKSYVILPTTLLVKQVVETLQKFCEKLNLNASFNERGDLIILHFHSDLKKDERERFFKLLEEGAFNILVTTSQFLPRYFPNMKHLRFDFIFVDDVDSVLKASKNVDRILQLLGFYYDAKERKWKGKAKGSLMVSTATAKRGQKVQLFRELLNFDVGTSTHAVRNIEDVAVNSEDIDVLCDILKRMGSGGLIYARSTEEAERLYEILKDKFKVGIVTAGKKKDFELFEKGELDYLIGTAYYYGTLVRGLDLPERIRFCIFYGAPIFRVKVEDVDTASVGVIRTLAMIFRTHEEVKKFIPYLAVIDKRPQDFEELKKILKRLLEVGGVEEKDIVVRKGEIIFPDVRTYIQGSGRTSRLFAGGITKGASFLLEKDLEILKAFVERAKFYDIEFKSLDEVDFEKLVKEIDESRERFKRKTEFDVIRPTLFIVESPTKAKQIARFFGQPSVKVFTEDGELELVAYEVPTPEHVLIVTACIGHVTDLITNMGFHGVITNGRFIPIYASIKRCRDCGYQFTEEREDCPRCGSKNVDDSKRRIKALRKLAHDVDLIIIGTDPDSEGEKIAWDLRNLLAGCGVIKRAEFHEVTRRAVTEALKNLRDIDENLVKAQIVRRVEDRWIGFVLSQKLWDVFGDRNLSAGRAQTPVLGWVIQRYEEYKQKKKVAIVRELDLTLDVEDTKEEIELEIELVEEREEERTPLPPYTTDTMLRDANAILKIPARDAMKLAQDLFELGLCTYHRTDSTRVSDVGLRIAKEYLGDDFVARDWYMEGAHECIRPTRPIPKETLQRLIQEGVIQVEGITARHLALYDLIFRRFMASQCKQYKVKVAKYLIRYNGKEVEEERVLSAEGRAIELYKWSVWVKPALPTGKIKVKAEVRTVPRAPLFTQSDIVRLMKERGIGRPSTYATIVDRLFIRNYVIEKNGRVIPTKRGMDVFNYLASNYGKFVSEERTRLLEEKMDAVERGELDYFKALQELYEEIREIT
jgi:reverse gyrase